MTDDEIREALRLDFEQTADWRRSKAAEHPEDSRNLEAAALKQPDIKEAPAKRHRGF